MDKSVIARELHRPGRRNFPTRMVTVKGLDDLYQADLVEMIPYARQNKGYRYIITIINCLSKFALAIPIKSKSADDVVKAMHPILAQYPMKHLQTDDGKEWFNSKFQQLVQQYGINHYSTFSDKKASIVERFNRTLKHLMWVKFTERGTYRWTDILTSLVKEYNGRVHRTIGMRPADVEKVHEKLLLSKLGKQRQEYQQGLLDKSQPTFYPGAHQKIEPGDKVRISKHKMTFDKGYLPNWTNELFTVTRVRPTVPVTYELEDYRGEPVQGGFYAEEIVKTKVPTVFEIAKVLKRRGNKLLVRWKGYDRSHDSWIDRGDLV